MSRPAISSATSNDFLPRGRQIACGFASGIQPQRLPRGLTLIELLIATTLSLLMMGAVVTVFAMVSSSISDSRATMLMTDRLRSAVLLLQQDLGGATAVPMTPPLQPDKQQGYFEILQGVTGVSNTSSSDKNPFSTTNNVFVDKSNNSAVAPAPNGQTPDATCGDSGDVLMFTSRIPNSPFTGRCGLTTSGQVNYIQSPVAELAWFMRGRTLYRRVLLVAPWQAINSSLASSFYQYYDISANLYNPATGNERGSAANPVFLPNSLGDLTKRENRFMHVSNSAANWPFNNATAPPFPWPSVWGAYVLPTLTECSTSAFSPYTGPSSSVPPFVQDLWSNVQTDREPASMAAPGAATRTAEDVVLTNVISFDVKVWDPGAPIFSWNGVAIVPDDPGYSNLLNNPSGATVIGVGAYVNLGYQLPANYYPTTANPQGMYSLPTGAPLPVFAFCQKSGQPNYDSLTPGNASTDATFIQVSSGGANYAYYDTWSTHYNQGFFPGTLSYQGYSTNGFDDTGVGMIFAPENRDSKPPYPYPLRGIQVSIRAFDPESRQVRQITIVQDFLPQ